MPYILTAKNALGKVTLSFMADYDNLKSIHGYSCFVINFAVIL